MMALMRQVNRTPAARGGGAAATLLCLLSAGTASAGEPVDGRVDYLQYCAVCHGPEARGDGPGAAHLTLAPGDLTTLAAANGGSFPETFVYRIIDGRDMLSGHGTREMPVWGTRFAAAGASETEVEARIDALVRHLAALQTTAVGDAP